MLDNVDHRNKVSILLGLIISALLRKYLFNSMFEFANQPKNVFGGILDTTFDVILSATVVGIVYFLYPLFIRKKAK
jgi:hypothetical protein